MNLSEIRLPRQLEADDSAGNIRRILADRAQKLWPGGNLDVSVVPMSEYLKKVIRLAKLKGQLRYGYEGISDHLENERKGIANARHINAAPQGGRVSRLLLFSNDGADRFYRHIEQLLQAYSPRLLGCLLDIDSRAMGLLLTGQDRQIKLVMIEHKAIVSQALRAIVDGATALPKQL